MLGREINDYGYSLMGRYFMFKDPKAINQKLTQDEYPQKVVLQVREDIARIHCSESLLVKKEEIAKYIKSGYNVIGIKILLSNDMMHPMFYKINKNNVKRKVNMKVKRYKVYPETADDINVVDYFVAYKERES